jgi:hypothetical protein
VRKINAGAITELFLASGLKGGNTQQGEWVWEPIEFFPLLQVYRSSNQQKNVHIPFSVNGTLSILEPSLLHGGSRGKEKMSLMIPASEPSGKSVSSNKSVKNVTFSRRNSVMSIVLVSLVEKSDATENYLSGPEPALI